MQGPSQQLQLAFEKIKQPGRVVLKDQIRPPLGLMRLLPPRPFSFRAACKTTFLYCLSSEMRCHYRFRGRRNEMFLALLGYTHRSLLQFPVCLGHTYAVSSSLTQS